MADLPRHEAAWVRNEIAKRQWTYAKTYDKTYPHEYITRFQGDREAFDHFHRLITQFGHIQLFHGTPRPYLVVDDWKYWRMERVLVPRVLYVINRAQPVSKTYGPQWAPDTRRIGPATAYDFASVDWDQRVPDWVTPDEIDSMRWMLEQMTHGSVVNVGCGHGRLHDLVKIRPSRFLGLDPSQGMLNVHVERHKLFRVQPWTLGEYAEGSEAQPWDAVLALWGTADHLTEAEIEYADELASEHLLLMFHGKVQPIEKINPRAIERARDLPGVTEAEYGRWRVIYRSSRLL